MRTLPRSVLTAGIYDAPVPPPPAPPAAAPLRGALPADATSESVIFKGQISAPRAAGVGQELLIGSTSRPWRAVDVFVDPSELGAGSSSQGETIYRVRVYAVSDVTRALVATGFFVGGTRGNLWVASARVVAPRFEVTIQPGQVAVDFPGADQALPFAASIVARDEADDAPPWVGAEVVSRAPVILGAPSGTWSVDFAAVGYLGMGVGVPAASPEWDHVRLAGGRFRNAALSTRFVQFWNAETTDFPLHVTARPVVELAIPSTGVVDLPEWATRLPGQAFDRGCTYAVSSTSGTYTATAPGDVVASISAK